jgi:small subunit ribosomal protein S6
MRLKESITEQSPMAKEERRDDRRPPRDEKSYDAPEESVATADADSEEGDE